MAGHNLLAEGSTGLGRLVIGYVFATGLMIVLIAGAELFTGNTMIIVSILDKKATVAQMLQNWLWVYIGNFFGSVLIAWLWSRTGLFNQSGGMLGGMTVRIAYNKATMGFFAAFSSGILCNWLVCLAVWASFASKDMAGKAITTFFIISLFVISGFEHSVANMYYIPAGIFASATPRFVELANVANIANLNWGSFALGNLVPVTLGNIVGGLFFVGVLYWLALTKKKTS